MHVPDQRYGALTYFPSARARTHIFVSVALHISVFDHWEDFNVSHKNALFPSFDIYARFKTQFNAHFDHVALPTFIKRGRESASPRMRLRGRSKATIEAARPKLGHKRGSGAVSKGTRHEVMIEATSPLLSMRRRGAFFRIITLVFLHDLKWLQST